MKDHLPARKTGPRSLRLLLLSLLILTGLTLPVLGSPVSMASDEEWDVLKIVNQNRMNVGKPPLSMIKKMQDATDIRAKELETLQEHKRPDGRDCFTVLKDLSISYNSTGENIASGRSNATDVMIDWMNSPPHRKTILSEELDFDHIGVGHYQKDASGRHRWVQLFIGSRSNSFSNLRLQGNSSNKITVPAGKTLASQNLVLTCTSSVYGDCYLPLLDQMAPSYSPSKGGTQTVTVTYRGQSLTLTVTAAKGTQSAPTGLRAEHPSRNGAFDGRITGTTTAMEYRKEGQNSYSACTGSAISNLGAGTYQIRYKETGSAEASPAVSVKLTEPPAKTPQNPPVNLTTVNAHRGQQDGVISGVSSAMEYRRTGSSSYIRCAGSRIEGLAPDTYFVRYAETASQTASPDTQVVVREDTEKEVQNRPTGLTSKNPGSREASDGAIYGTTAQMEYLQDGSTVYLPCTGNSINNLPAGSYDVRYRETDRYAPSFTTRISIAFPIPAAPADPGEIASEAEWEFLRYVNQYRIQNQAEPMGIVRYAREQADHAQLINAWNESSSSFMSYSPDPHAIMPSGFQVEGTPNGPRDYFKAQSESPSVSDFFLDPNHYIGIHHAYFSSSSHHAWSVVFYKNTWNEFSALRLLGNPSAQLQLPYGESLTDQQLVLQCETSIDGSCYLPLIDEMVTGYDPHQRGPQTAVVRYQGLSLTLHINQETTTEKLPQEAPRGLYGYGPSAVGQRDGSITGVNDRMEYRSIFDESYRPCTADRIDGLSVGFYAIRYRETDSHLPSPDHLFFLQVRQPGEPEEPGKPEGPEDPDDPNTPGDPEKPEGPSEPLMPLDPAIASDVEWSVLKLVNQERMAEDLHPLALFQRLQRAGGIRVRETVASFSHTRPNGSSYATVFSEVSLSPGSSGENIAAGQGTANQVMSSWMSSPGHRSNILSERYSHVGVSHTFAGGDMYGHYWTQLFLGNNQDGISNLSLYSGNPKNLQLPLGEPLAQQPLVLQYESESYGTCYLPLIDEMAEGFDPNRSGLQQVTVRFRDLSLSLLITVGEAESPEKSPQKAPTGFYSFAPTAPGRQDGRIYGVSSQMEYHAEGSTVYLPCGDATLENLSPGNYYIRYRETDSHLFSPDTLVNVPAPESIPDPGPSPTPSPNPYPTPSPDPNPDPYPTPSPEPYPTPSPDPNPNPYPTPSPDPNPEPNPYPTPSPDPEPNPYPTPSPDPDPEPNPYPTPSPDPSPSPDPGPKPPISNPFTDVSPADWYYDPVLFVVERQLFSGTSETSFSPKSQMSRAMMVQVLYNLEQPGSGYLQFFSDVPGDSWYADAVAWAAANDIVSGVGNNQFAPNRPVTRQEMAVILNNYAGHRGIRLPILRTYSGFSDDSKIAFWAAEAVQNMYCAEVLNGHANGGFTPAGNAIRAEVAAMFRNFVTVIEAADLQ